MTGSGGFGSGKGGGGCGYGHYFGDRAEDGATGGLWVRGNTSVWEHQDRPDVASHLPGEVGEPLRPGAPAIKLPPSPASQPHTDPQGAEGQAAAPSSAGPTGADTSICRVPSLVLNHSALLIGDE